MLSSSATQPQVSRHAGLSQDDIDDLKQIFRDELGESLGDDEAWDVATRVLNFVWILTNTKDGSNSVRLD